MENLWPTIERKNIHTKAPSSILKEQAYFLGYQTNNLVQAKVHRFDIDEIHNSEYEFCYRFFIVARTLDNYHYSLFDIEHGIDFYPVSFKNLGDDILEEFGFSGLKRNSHGVAVKDEGEFLEALKVVFAATKTQRVIRNLLLQVDPDFYRPAVEKEDASF